jgi:hypothetical protein
LIALKRYATEIAIISSIHSVVWGEMVFSYERRSPACRSRWQAYVQNDIARNCFVSLAGISLLAASCSIWSTERHNVIELQSSITKKEMERPRLELIFDESNLKCVRDEYCFNAFKARHWSIGSRNSSLYKSADDIMIIANASWFVDNTIVATVANRYRRIPNKSPVIVSYPTLQPGAEEFIELFGLGVGRSGDVFDRQHEFIIEARGRDVETTTITLIYEPSVPLPTIKRKARIAGSDTVSNSPA